MLTSLKYRDIMAFLLMAVEHGTSGHGAFEKWFVADGWRRRGATFQGARGFVQEPSCSSEAPAVFPEGVTLLLGMDCKCENAKIEIVARAIQCGR